MYEEFEEHVDFTPKPKPSLIRAFYRMLLWNLFGVVIITILFVLLR